MTKQSFPISYSVVPQEGPRCLQPIVLTFAAAGIQYVSLNDELQNSEELNHCQAVYIDAADAGGTVTFTALQTGQRIRVPNNRQGWFNVMFPPGVCDFSVQNGAAGFVNIIIANEPVAPSVWATV